MAVFFVCFFRSVLLVLVCCPISVTLRVRMHQQTSLLVVFLNINFVNKMILAQYFGIVIHWLPNEVIII